MTRLVVVVIASGLPAACVSTGSQAPATTLCNKTDRTGTYEPTRTKQGGDLPQIDRQLVSFDADGGAAGKTCPVHSNVWSQGNCKNERTTHPPSANLMPPLASNIVDEPGLNVVDDWITSVASCP